MKITFLTGLLSTLLSSATLADSASWQAFANPVLDKAITSSLELQKHWQSYCAGSEEHLEKAQISWVELASQWTGFQSLASRRVEESNLSFRLWFWPDTKDLTRKQTNQYLSNEASPKSSPAPAVAIGGLEYFLYQDIPDTKSSQCLHALKLIENFQGNLQEIANSDNSEADEAPSVQVNSLANLIANASKRVSAYNRNGKSENIYGMDGWRSKSQNKLINAQLTLGLALAQSIDNQFPEADSGNLIQQFEKAVQLAEQEWQFERSVELLVQTHQIQEALSKQLAPSLKVTLGFNNSDGD